MKNQPEDFPKSEMWSPVNCLSCAKPMFGVGPIDKRENSPNGIFWFTDIGEVEHHSDGEDWFWICPHCGAKNVTVSSSSDKWPGLLNTRIDHIKL